MQDNKQQPGTPEANSEPTTSKAAAPPAMVEAAGLGTAPEEHTQPPTPEPGAATARKEVETSPATTKTKGTPKAPNQEKKHPAPLPDYTALSLEKLLSELQRLLRCENIAGINKQVSAVKREFDQKFQALTAHKKEVFMAEGGQEEDFQYTSITKKQFDAVLAEYREKRNQYHQQLEQTRNDNLQKRLALIEQLKGLVTVAENTSTTYNTFKALQKQWQHAGPVPQNHYRDMWRTYQHHVELFYDFLQLNRELRDRDFKHNLTEKQKLITRAEALAEEPDLRKALKELQTLHKVWREATGPVPKEQRAATWERFSKATAVLHQRKEHYFQELKEAHEKNLEKKTAIISSLKALANTISDNHKDLQHQIHQVEALRQAFFTIGKVPQKSREQTWTAFKEALREFNHNKNAFYKALKKERQQNLEKKRALLAVALSFKDSEDWETATREMKRVQYEWKNTGPVSKKESDTLWNAFKEACSHYFSRLQAEIKGSPAEEQENFDKKKAYLVQLKDFAPSGDTEKDLAALKHFLRAWKEHGHVPHDKKYIDVKFRKSMAALFKKIGLSPRQAALAKYDDRLQQLAHTTDPQALRQEETLIKRKIKKNKSEIRQLENNLQFFSNASENSPLVKKVADTIRQHKETLEIWKAKLKKLQNIESNHNKQSEDT